jgi:uncharacterized protein
MIVFTTLLIVQVYNHTERSILAVLIFHGIMNFTGEVLGISADMYPFVISGYALSAMFLSSYGGVKRPVQFSAAKMALKRDGLLQPKNHV